MEIIHNILNIVPIVMGLWTIKEVITKRKRFSKRQLTVTILLWLCIFALVLVELSL